MNKKLLILIIILVILIGATGYLYMDDILKLAGIGAKQEVALELPPALPTDDMQPHIVFSNSLKKMTALNMKAIGYPENTIVKSFKGVINLNVILPDNILATFPKGLEKFKTLDFNFDIKMDAASSKLGLGFETPFTKKMFALLSDPEIKLFLPESNIAYILNPEELKAMNMSFSFKESFYFSDYSPEKLQELFEITKIEENPRLVTLSVKPLEKKVMFGKTFNEEMKIKINKRNFLIEQIENVVKDENDNIIDDQSVKIDLHYAQDNHLLIKIDGVNSVMPDQKIELVVTYRGELVSEIRMRSGEKDFGVIKYAFDETPKIIGLSYQNEFNGVKLAVNINDMIISQAGLEDYEFAPENSEEFEIKNLADLTNAFSDKKIAMQLFLKEDADKIIENVMPMIVNMAMANAKTTVTTTVSDAEEDDADDAEDENEGSTAPAIAQKPVAVPQPTVKPPTPVKSPETVQTKPVVQKEIDDDEDDEEDEDEPIKATPAPQKEIKQPVKAAPEKKITAKPAAPAPSKQAIKAEPEYQPKPQSQQFIEIVRLYNHKQNDQSNVLAKLNELIKQETDNVEAFYMIGYINFQLKNIDAATANFDKVLKIADLNDKFERQIYYWSRMMKKNLENLNNSQN